jgi:hypothetical protein
MDDMVETPVSNVHLSKFLVKARAGQAGKK